MSDMEIVMIGLGLSMDAFAAAICRGCMLQRLQAGQILLTGLFFGVFQGLMPVAGYFLGKQAEASVSTVSAWVAFGLLLFIGSKMLWEAAGERDASCGEDKPYAAYANTRSSRQQRPAMRKKQTTQERQVRQTLREMRTILSLAVATSIDAMAAGLTFGVLQTDIVAAAVIIGTITGLLSSAGVVIGCLWGGRQKEIAVVLGGLLLIAMGIKIIVEHGGR